MVNDTISDMLTRIRNANLVKNKTVLIPNTRMNKKISQILEKEGLIESFGLKSQSEALSPQNNLDQANLVRKVDKGRREEKNRQSRLGLFSSQYLALYLKYKGRYQKPCITNLRRISKPGLRVYANHKELPKILGGMGLILVSTSKGIMTDREARFKKLGGELICSVW